MSALLHATGTPGHAPVSPALTAPPEPLRLTALRELWVHTGTSCNLSCPFCHEGSHPGDRRIEPPGFAEIARELDAAAAAGAERFVFTGGEPLILRDIGRILEHALRLRPALVLTNGIAPLIRRSQQLAVLAALPHALEFRVSLDYADEARHDAQRGPGNFRKAIQGLKLLHAAGFAVSVARQSLPGESPAAVQAADGPYRALFRRHGLPTEMSIRALVELGPPGTGGISLLAGRADVAGSVAPPTLGAERGPLCSRARMLLRRNGALSYFACALVDDDPRFDLGNDLQAAVAQAVAQVHPRCALCRRGAVTYG